MSEKHDASLSNQLPAVKDADKWQKDLRQQFEEKIRMLENKNQELLRSQDRYYKMIDEVQDYAILLLDEKGIIQNWNKGAQTIKQYQQSEAVGQHVRMFYLPEDRENKLPEQLLNEAAVNGRAHHEGWRLRKDQTKFWGSVTLTALHNKDGDITGYSKVTRDLTEKKIAEDELKSSKVELQERNEALRKSEEQYHKMISEVKDYAIILLNQQGDIQNWNEGAEKIKGYKAAEIVGKNFQIFYTQQDQESNFPGQLLANARKNGQALHEGWRVRKDGSRFWGSIVITCLHAEDGSIIGFSKVTRDLTERKLAEDKLQEYLQELESKNKELEQFAYIASHDLQEPLRKIQIFTNLIEKNFHDELLAKNYFEKIDMAAKRMSELIRSILDYSRLSDDSRIIAEINANQVLNNTLLDFELLIEEKHAVIKYEPIPVFKAIPMQVNQLFVNLIGNALKFNTNKPVIRVTSKIIAKDHIDDAPLHMMEDNYLEIAVADNGIGFDEEYEQKIFSLFQRLHSKQDFAGTGIGLALCSKIMENHRGFIKAKGQLGVGATFYVYFPM